MNLETISLKWPLRLLFSVVEEGLVAAGDTIERIHEDENGISVSDIDKLFRNGSDLALMRRVTRLEPLPVDWRGHFIEKLAVLERESS